MAYPDNPIMARGAARGQACAPWHTRPVDFDRIDDLARRFAENGRQPGFAYGIVVDGELAHTGGQGERVLGAGQVPDQDTVFRIASMSKSFTASVIMSLRDEGALALADTAADYVPELRDWPPDQRVTIADLLTMTAGFPTDDPWGDRQQGLPLDDFGKLLASGVSFNWAPGTRFEYSNLGYAILGRLITEVTGRPFKDVVRERFLVPLGMTSTGYEAAEYAPGTMARGYRKVPDGWEEVPYDPYGAFAPMGGVFSTVRDLTRWVGGFAAAFPPGGAVDRHPLGPSSRREMQLPRVTIPGAGFEASAYGYGLFLGEDPAWGRIVSHSGGYPGFGSNMRWHPGTGTGAIALANGTYARMSALAAQLLAAALRRGPRPAVPLAPGQAPWPQTLAAADTVNGLLHDWDDVVADDLFAPNVPLDSPYPERRDLISRVRDRLGGDFAPDDTRPAESDTPAHRRWWLTGELGTVQVQIQLSPQRPPRVQSLTIAVPPAAGSGLGRAVESVVKFMNEGGDLRVTAGADVARWERRLRMAAAWAGEVRPAMWRAGDGETTTTADLLGDHATLHLTLAADPEGAIRDLTLTGF
jgi:CubicO group peptidase (beta-lactamase class C family)